MRKELEEEREAVLEWEKKLKFKEETAEAAMAARDAAEKSLRLADTRASRLRDRVEELTRQLDSRETSTTTLSRPHRYICWSWQWLGLDYVGSHRSETPSNLSLSNVVGHGRSVEEEESIAGNTSVLMFQWDEIAAATNHFSSSNIIGHGRFGGVYKAVLSSGEVVAVKRCSRLLQKAWRS